MQIKARGKWGLLLENEYFTENQPVSGFFRVKKFLEMIGLKKRKIHLGSFENALHSRNITLLCCQFNYVL